MPRRSLLKSRTIANALLAIGPQSGVIPYRRTSREIEVLLITSSRRRRWTIPKGFVKTGLSPLDSAGEEAWEEAGVRGVVSQAPIGRYSYTKRALPLSVTVFSMRVETIFEVWPENWKRQRKWMSLAESIAIIEEPGLRNLIETFGIAFSETQIDV